MAEAVTDLCAGSRVSKLAVGDGPLPGRGDPTGRLQTVAGCRCSPGGRVEAMFSASAACGAAYCAESVVAWLPFLMREDGGMACKRAGPPDVLFVNGASSAGKTTLVRGVQDLVSEPYMHVGLDHCFAAIPEPWGGGGPGRYSAAGFTYESYIAAYDGLPRTSIVVGPTGAAILAAYRRSLVTLLQRGCRLAIDELLLSDEIGADYLTLLAPYDVQYVLMTADPGCLEKRCGARNYRPGFGRWSLTAADRLPRSYDLVLDSSRMSAQECAKQVAASWNVRY
jgi:chloramphenicol 3-O phosphotransferase